MILDQIKSQNIENIVIFVCDALRWDYTPTSVIKKGISIKTIAASLYTASSFPSMISGLYPPKTGVHTWDDILPQNLRGLFSMDGYNSSLWCETTWTNLPPDKSAIHMVLGSPKGISLESIQTPFVYIEDDKGGHCPFGFSFNKYEEGGCNKFFKEYGKKGRKELINQYKIGIEKSVKQFERRIELLEKRELIKNTLIIFTSDHGELLGEYGGLTHHSRPPCPELVYVPTVFVHPSLEPKNICDKIIRHVDLYPTIISILNKKLRYETDGTDLTINSPPSKGLNFRLGGYHRTKNKINKWMNYESSSVWDQYGGHIFHSLGTKRANILFLYKLLIQKHPEFNFLRENQKNNSINKIQAYKTALKHLTSSHLNHLKPNFSKEEAEKIIDNYMQESIDFKEKNKMKRSIQKLKKLGKFNV